MDAKELFKRSIAQATQVVDKVEPTDFSAPTPDADWDVRTLAAHMLYELSWTADIVQGRTAAEVGDKYEGDLMGERLAQSWETAATSARAAIERADLQATAHLSYGDVTVEDYLIEAASDQLIHAWDLGTAINLPVRFDPEVTQAVYDKTLPRLGGMRASGLFGEPVDVPDNADLQTKLLALYGRRAIGF